VADRPLPVARPLHPALGARFALPRYKALASATAEHCAKGQDPCVCAQAQAQAALDLEQNKAAIEILDGASACGPSGQLMGLRAETYAREQRLDEATALAEERLRVAPDDPFALYALGYVAYQRKEDALAALRLLEASKKGRVVPAHSLMTLLFFRANDLKSARQECQKVLSHDPDHLDALYNLALIDQREDRYHAAREGYLKVLRIEPHHVNSRYNLALLTHAAGAVAEARHNLTKLSELVGSNDSRVQALAALLEGEASNGAGVKPP
jgi:tetratricopeptide (TPR) repeat protein